MDGSGDCFLCYPDRKHRFEKAIAIEGTRPGSKFQVLSFQKYDDSEVARTDEFILTRHGKIISRVRDKTEDYLACAKDQIGFSFWDHPDNLNDFSDIDSNLEFRGSDEELGLDEESDADEENKAKDEGKVDAASGTELSELDVPVEPQITEFQYEVDPDIKDIEHHKPTHSRSRGFSLSLNDFYAPSDDSDPAFSDEESNEGPSKFKAKRSINPDFSDDDDSDTDYSSLDVIGEVLLVLRDCSRDGTLEEWFEKWNIPKYGRKSFRRFLKIKERRQRKAEKKPAMPARRILPNDDSHLQTPRYGGVGSTPGTGIGSPGNLAPGLAARQVVRTSSSSSLKHRRQESETMARQEPKRNRN